MAGNEGNSDGLAAGKVVGGANAQQGFRNSPAYNIVLAVVIAALAVGVVMILLNQNKQPDGAELLKLTELRVQKQAEKYLATKVVKADGVEVPKDLSFKVSSLRFTTPNVEEVRELPAEIQFEMDLVTTGAPDEKQGKVTGYYSKVTGEMLLNYDLIYMHDSVPSSYHGWTVE